MLFIDDEVLAARREIYTKGSEVRLVSMDDPNAPPIGIKGKVLEVDDRGSILVQWNNGQKMKVLYGFDECELIGKSRPVMLPFRCYKVSQAANGSLDKEYVGISRAVSAEKAENNMRFNLGFPAKVTEMSGYTVTFEAVPA